MPNRLRLPTHRNALAYLYMLCARAQGVRPVYTAGQHTGFTGPKLAIYEYLERMRRLHAPAPPDPARLTVKQQRVAVERWRRQQKQR